jgi:hypothetical protein
MKPSLIVIVSLAFLAVLLVGGLIAKANSRARIGKYRRRTLMTANEREFFGRLRAALPDHLVFPQVAMSALIEASSADQKQAFRDRLRIAQQRVDYLVCDQQGEIVVVVELDDRTHSPDKDKVRDARLLQAGIKTIRFQSKNKPAYEAIRAAVFPPPLPTLETGST